MAQDLKAERERFEPAYRETSPLAPLRRLGDGYAHIPDHIAWLVWLAARRTESAELERVRKDAEWLRTVMIAAAEEIHAHWEAHCDADGYGPANLMRRLEEGIPSEYGYTAGAFADLKARTTWQPMETAPKDGRHILLAWGGEPRLGWWLDNSASIRPWAGWKVPSLQAMPVGCEPKGWMPIPAIDAAMSPSPGGER